MSPTVTEYVAEVISYVTVFEGVNVQKMVNFPRTLYVLVSVKVAPELLFNLNTNVPAIAGETVV